MFLFLPSGIPRYVRGAGGELNFTIPFCHDGVPIGTSLQQRKPECKTDIMKQNYRDLDANILIISEYQYRFSDLLCNFVPKT